MTTADFGIRVPTMDEMRAAFGSAARALECTRGDLPTVLYFLANQDRIAGFKSPKGARRVGHADFARKLREAASEDKAAERARIDREVAAAVAERVRAHLERIQDPKRPVLVSKVARAITLNNVYRVTVKQVREALATIGGDWIVRESKPRKPRGRRAPINHFNNTRPTTNRTAR